MSEKYNLPSLLIVDDDQVNLLLLAEFFSNKAKVFTANSAEGALAQVSGAEKGSIQVILSDVRLGGGMDGLALLHEIKRLDPGVIVVLMTGFGELEGAIQAIQRGAFDYVSKPFRLDEVATVIERAFFQSIQAREVSPDDTIRVSKARALLGRTAKMVEIFKAIGRASLTESTVLVRGESGTGKELVARAIHENSSRKGRPFVAVNCGAIPDSLLESELFGYTKGAFTGAVADKVGLVEEAFGGTLFLDEIGDVPAHLQVKLLRLLQDREYRPVGSVETRAANVRILAATHRDLENMVKLESFREDLYYRLKVIEIRLPPLRERREDIPELVETFLKQFAQLSHKRIDRIHEDSLKKLQTYDWPGNVRELEHVIERAIAMTRTQVILPEDLGLDSVCQTAAPNDVPLERIRSLELIEKEAIEKTLQSVAYNKTRAAEILGIDRVTLYRKASRYGISLDSSASAGVV